MQLVWHTSSSAKGVSHEGSIVTRRHACRYLHVHLHSRCSICSAWVLRLRVGMVTNRDCCEHVFQVIVLVKLQRSDHTVVQRWSTLHVRRNNEGIVINCRLVCLTIQHIRLSVQCREASTCFAKVFFGCASHAGSSVSYLNRINS